MTVFVLGTYDVRTIKFTAAQLGLTTTLVGLGTVVDLVDELPVGWSVKEVQIRLDGTITSAGGTTVANVGTSDDAGLDNIVNALDIEGVAGWATVTTTRQEITSTPKKIQAQVETATAAPTAVAGLTFEVVLTKVDRE